MPGHALETCLPICLSILVMGAVAAAPASAVPSTLLEPAAAPPPAAAANDIPHGKPVYKSNFGAPVGKEWWPQWTERTAAGNRAFLGTFGIEPVTFNLKDLPAHKFVRLHLSLFILETIDGSSPTWGPHPWEISVIGGRRLLYSTFDNLGFFRDNNEQAFPDDYPWGIHPGWTGTSEGGTLGILHKFAQVGDVPKDCSSVYDMVLVFPHEDKDLGLNLRAQWTKVQKKWGAAWGLESLEVEVLDGPQALTEAQLEAFWNDLGGDEAPQAFKSLWAMVSGGDKAVPFILGKLGHEATAPAKPPADEVDELVKQLDDPAFAVREKATQRLAQVGRPRMVDLQQIADKTTSPEVKVRLKWVLEKLSHIEVPPPVKPQISLLLPRAVRVLEEIGTPAALDALDRLALTEGSPAAPFAAPARQRTAEWMLGAILARAQAASRNGDAAGAEAAVKEAQAFAKAHLPEDRSRVAAVLAECRQRREVRAAADPDDAAKGRAAMWQRLALGDDPAGAAKLTRDPKEQEMLRLAGKAAPDLTDPERKTLREFYLAGAKDADGRTRAELVSRAMAVVRPANEQTTDAFDPAEGVPPDLLATWTTDLASRGQWANLLLLLDAKDIPKRNSAIPFDAWGRTWNGLRAGGSPQPLVLPLQPGGSYQIRFQYTPCRNDDLAAWVPVGDKHVCVTICSADGSAAIRTKAGGAPAAAGQWQPPDPILVGEYVVDLTVEQAGGDVTIRQDVGGRPMMAWRGKAADIEKMDGAPPEGHPSLIMKGGWIILKTAALRMLDGTLAPPPPDKPRLPVDRGSGIYGVPSDGAPLDGD